MSAPVGFVGLGNIGKPMARRLAGSDDLELWVFDIADGPVEELVGLGAERAGSVADMAGRVDVMCVMVRDDAQVEEVLDQALAGAAPREGRPALTFVVHSTVGPDTPALLAARGGPGGVMVVDAPVSGGAMGAAEGTLAIMVGGEKEAFDAAAPVLGLMGSKVVHAGPIGSGTRFKLARNLLHFAAFTAATEAQRLAEAAGLDLVAFGDVVRHTDAVTGGPGAILHRRTTAPIAEGEFWYGVFGHVVDLGEKDLRHAITLAGELGVEVPFARMALEGLAPGLGIVRGAGDANSAEGGRS